MALHMKYAPILKGKDGEFLALETLSDECKNSITPIVEMVPFAEGIDEDKMITRIDKYIKQIVKKWGKGRTIYIDLHLIKQDYDFEIDGKRPLVYIFEELRKEEIIAIPVVRIHSPKIFYDDLKEVIEIDKRGFCIRLYDVDFSPKKIVKMEDFLSKILLYTNSEMKNIDLVIDLKDITEKEIDSLVSLTTSIINKYIPNVKKWRSLIFAASSFPHNLAKIASNAESQIERLEWNLWNNILKNNSLKRIPSYGDYSIAHSELPKVMLKVMNMTANIRYTTDNYWLVMKGQGVKLNGYGQFHTLSLVLTEKEEYSGAEFSWGDEYIQKCARKEVGKGNATTWRKVGNNRHITFVVSQLSNLREL